jgi:hypothetical protein
MKRVTLASADTFKRILFQEGRVTSLHAVALVVVGLSYLANHMSAASITPCSKGCGVRAILVSIVAWWPIVASWWIVKHPGETSRSFRWWQVLFVLINGAAIGGYVKADVSTLVIAHPVLWSILHCGLLMAIAPLAVESEMTGVGE